MKANKLKKVFNKCKVMHSLTKILSCNACNGNTRYNGKTVIFRHRMNNHITASRHGIFTDKFSNNIFKCSNKNDHASKEPYFKFMSLWQSIMKINIMNLTYIKWNFIQWTANCFTIIATVVKLTKWFVLWKLYTTE